MGLFKRNKIEKVELPQNEQIVQTRKIVQSILKVMTPEQVYRMSQAIGDWRAAQTYAEDPHNPDRYWLEVIYKDILDDDELTATARIVKNKLRQNRFRLVSNEEIDEEAQKIFKQKWFYDYTTSFYRSVLHGYIALNLQNLYPVTFEIIPTENAVPELAAIKKVSDGGAVAENLIYFEKSKYEIVELFESRYDLGLLNKITPYWIWKKVLGNWSQHAEIFGMPLRIGRVNDLEDTTRVQNMVQMLENMVSAAYGVFHDDDTLEFVNENKSDTYKIYDTLVDKCNQAIDKIIVGATSLASEKAFVGSAEVHERLLASQVEDLKVLLQFNINDVLLPLLKKYKVIGEDVSFEWDESKTISITEKVSIVKELLPHYKIPADQIKNWFDIEVEDKEEETNGMVEVVNKSISETYKNMIKEAENPFPNEHAARIKNPNLFVQGSFRRKTIARGVSTILGKLEGQSVMTVQSYRFSKDLFTVSRAKEWLKRNNVKYLTFEPAE